MNNSAFKKYTQKYYIIPEGVMSTVADTLLNTGGGAAIIGVAAPGLISGAMQGASLLKGAIDKFKFDKFGCKRIVDQLKRNECEARTIDKHIADLRNQIPYCKKSKTPDTCEQKIKNEIVKKTQEKVELKNLSTLASTGITQE